jgi:mRNA-degrading endonuclease YafQ of YafQ-DinJ toxin-antitoxin module
VWSIQEHWTIAKELTGAPKQIRKTYEFWKNVVRHSGPQGLQPIKKFKDHAMKGEWKESRGLVP